MRTVLFICTGNTCRSPMAEAIARQFSRDGALGVADDVFFGSAGISATEDIPTTFETISALRRRGIDFDGRSKPLTREMIEKADFVLCMTRAHAQQARELVHDAPDEVAKISTLHPDRDIEDPVGMGQEVYDRMADELASILPGRLEELLHHEDRAGL